MKFFDRIKKHFKVGEVINTQKLGELCARIDLLEAALQEAGEFAVKRLPHDMREHNAKAEYFVNMWTQCAAVSLQNLRGKTDGTR